MTRVAFVSKLRFERDNKGSVNSFSERGVSSGPNSYNRINNSNILLEKNIQQLQRFNFHEMIIFKIF